jgi:hypothetical protein
LLVLLALLVAFAPVLGVPYSDNEFQENGSGEYVSAPDDPRGDAGSSVRAALYVAEDLEEEADEEEGDNAICLALATLDHAGDAECWAAHAWFPAFCRPSAHFGTGPPIL